MIMLKKILLTVSATWSFVIVYYISRLFKLENTQLDDFWRVSWLYVKNNHAKATFLILGTIIMIFTPLVVVRLKKEEQLAKAKLIELNDNTYVPTYLGYFFVGMSVDNFASMVVFYLIIFVFTFFSGIEYFNPIFLFMGYHIYKVESDMGVQNIIILKTKNVIRRSNELNNLKLYRINNLTYIGDK